MQQQHTWQGLAIRKLPFRLLRRGGAMGSRCSPLGGNGGRVFWSTMERDCWEKISVISRFQFSSSKNLHLSRVILSLWVPVEHVITGRTEELSIALLTLDRRSRRTTEFAFLQRLRFQLDWKNVWNFFIPWGCQTESQTYLVFGVQHLSRSVRCRIRWPRSLDRRIDFSSAGYSGAVPLVSHFWVWEAVEGRCADCSYPWATAALRVPDASEVYCWYCCLKPA